MTVLSEMTALDSPDAAHMRQAMGRFATGVTIVSDHDAEGRLNAMTLNAFSSLSLDPALILICIRNEASMAPALSSLGHRFGVSVLAAGHAPLASAMARHDRDASRAEGFEDVDGVPLVDGAVAQIVAEVDAVHPGGDHLIVIGRVRGLRTAHGRPLTFLDGVLAT